MNVAAGDRHFLFHLVCADVGKMESVATTKQQLLVMRHPKGGGRCGRGRDLPIVLIGRRIDEKRVSAKAAGTQATHYCLAIGRPGEWPKGRRQPPIFHRLTGGVERHRRTVSRIADERSVWRPGIRNNPVLGNLFQTCPVRMNRPELKPTTAIRAENDALAIRRPPGTAL